MSIKRSIHDAVIEGLNDKIILLSGPRQVGKTFLSKMISTEYQYFNFDLTEHQKIIREKAWLRDGSLVIFDEIQKMKKWKQWIKGIYDTEKGKNRYLLTGSSRLDLIKKTGDSLAGRQYSFRLNPFSIAEIKDKDHQQVFEKMLAYGCFPEPLLSASPKKAALWRRNHIDLILRQDLILLEVVKDIISIEHLVAALRMRVGQQIVYSNLAAEVGTSIHTIKKWIQVLESLFVIFVVYPYTKNVLDAIKKEPKIYFYDVGDIEVDIGFKIENLTALHLLKRNQFLEDTEGHKTRLAYIRDKKKREIDFAIEQNGKLTHLIEVKKSDDNFNKQLDYFSKRLRPQYALHLVLELKREKDFENFKIRQLSKYLSTLET